MEHSVRPGLRFIDRLLLVSAWALSCGAVYGLGFYTGSQIQERMPDDEERVVRLPVTAQPPEAGQHAKAGDDFTFYDTLVPGAAQPRPHDSVTAERSAPEPIVPAKPDRAATKPSTKVPAKATARATGGESAGRPARKPPVGTATARTGVPARGSTSPAAGAATHAKMRTASTEPKPARTKGKQPAPAQAAGATAPKRPSSRASAPAGHARTPTTTARGNAEERSTARAARPREGVVRSAVASE
jgi:hypothetical protein